MCGRIVDSVVEAYSYKRFEVDPDALQENSKGNINSFTCDELDTMSDHDEVADCLAKAPSATTVKKKARFLLAFTRGAGQIGVA